MSLRDQVKVRDAGFTVFRKDEIRLTISQAITPGGWSPLGVYKSKAALKRTWDELMKHPMNLEG